MLYSTHRKANRKRKTMANMYRQGDVLPVKTNEIKKENKVEDQNGRTILALGEVTGHHHSFKSGVAEL